MPDLPPLPPIALDPLSVVLLAHNAEGHLEEVVNGWLTFLNGLGREYELLLVDDGSTDRTAELAARSPRVRLLRHASPQGIGAALRTGVAEARYSLLAHAPCDRQFRPDDLKRLLAEIDKSHLVSAYRVMQPVPAWLRYPGRVLRFLINRLFAVSLEEGPGWLGWKAHLGHHLARAIFGVRLKDVGCWLRLYRRAIFARIPIQSNGPFAQVEVLAKANFLGHVMTETPIRCGPDQSTGVGGATFREGYRVFAHPDFGPAVLTPPNAPSALRTQRGLPDLLDTPPPFGNDI